MRTIIAGNWKMHKDARETRALVDQLLNGLADPSGEVEVVIAPAFPFLADAVEQARGSGLRISAQNCHSASQGAFTGEVSAAMLQSIGVRHCIVGHSERRQFYGETDVAVNAKIKALLNCGITPIYCCGEKREERESDRHFEVVAQQVKVALGDLPEDLLTRIVVAYEPVWAIGTGLTASAAQAQDMHAHIRGLLRSHSVAVAASVPILYGGSCKPENAADIFAGADVDGGLIGGAALVAEQFLEIVRIANNSRIR
jgi:triosephosphate isomerase (TIM)